MIDVYRLEGPSECVYAVLRLLLNIWKMVGCESTPCCSVAEGEVLETIQKIISILPLSSGTMTSLSQLRFFNSLN